MIASFLPALQRSFLPLVCALLAAAASAQSSSAARVTRVINDVKIIQGQAARAASVNEEFASGVIRTAGSSRAEVVRPDGFVARLAANTFLSLSRGGSGVALNQGAALFEAPIGLFNAKIALGTITIDTAGATVVVERFGGTYVKILVLQGKARAYLAQPVGESVLVDAGQLLISKPNPKALPEPVDFDLAQFFQTSSLTNSDFRPLPSKPLIIQAITQQRKNPDLNATNLVIDGRGTLVRLVEGTEPAPPSPRASSSPAVKASPRPKR